MDRESAHKYLEGDTSVLTDPQPASTEGTPSSTEPTQADPVDNHEPAEPSDTGSTEPVSASEDHESQSQEPAKPEDNDTPDPSKKPEKLPYPKAKPDDVRAFKANKAFIKLKEKHKAKVAGLEAQISNLKAQIEKLKTVSPDNLSDDQKADLKLESRLAERDLNSLTRAKQDAELEMASAEADQIHEARIAKCFTDPSEVEHYHRLLENGRDKFVEFLNKVDPEGAVIDYLDDCEVSPLMVRLLMTNPNVLKSVVTKRNPLSKAIELRSIENKMLMSMKLRSKSRSPQSNQNPNPNNPPPATTGKVVGNGASANKAPKSKADWQAYLASHP